MGAWYWLFTILGECVVSSEIGTTPKIETHGWIKIIIINFVCLGEARWGRSLPGLKTQILFLIRHMYPVMKVHESVERRAKLAVRPRKFTTQINKRDLVKLIKHWRVVQWVESLGETLMTGFHTWHCRSEGVSWDSGCGYEQFHLMYNT